MTAINVIRHVDAVHVLTDGRASIMGHPTVLLPKCYPLPHINAAVACAGIAFQTALLAHDLAMAAQTFDELKDKIIETVRTLIDRNRFLFSLAVDTKFLLVVAGFSERRGPESYLLTNDESHNFATWEVHTCGDVFLQPGTADVHRAFHQEVVAGRTSGEQFDPVADGVALLEIQRRNHGHGVGGFAQVTSVTREGISTRIVHRWSDAPAIGATDAAAA